VRNVIERRSDGRPVAAEPLDAFVGELEALGHGRFRTWWLQQVAELRRQDPVQNPTAAIILAASLAESALIFTVKQARAAGLMKGSDFDGPAKQWKFAALIKGAKASDPSVAILDERTAQRCQDLNENRQRIHAGALIDQVPTGAIPDTRPEQAREAKQTLDAVLRRLLDWLGQRRASGASPSN
jgi:hypothetical protein